MPGAVAAPHSNRVRVCRRTLINQVEGTCDSNMCYIVAMQELKDEVCAFTHHFRYEAPVLSPSQPADRSGLPLAHCSEFPNAPRTLNEGSSNTKPDLRVSW